ncbi:MAG: hypothetical protein U0790_26030 [Isosphaeraceae bacterium]
MKRTGPRLHLRSALFWTAFVALLLAAGVHSKRRHDWYMRKYMVHGRESDRLERAIVADHSLTGEEVNSRFRAVHWHGYAATFYYRAAWRPWLSFRADPSRPYCICRYCQARPWLSPEELRVPDIPGTPL